MSYSDDEKPATAEDIILSVLQTKSKLGGRLHRYSNRKTWTSDNDTASSVNIQDESLQHHHKSEFTPAGKSSHLLLRNPVKLDEYTPSTQHKPNRMFHSTSKITRSVSTPEINGKYMPEPVACTKSKAQRQVIFSPKCNSVLDMLNNPDELTQILNTKEANSYHNNFTNMSKSSSHLKSHNLLQKKNNTDSTKQYHRNTWCSDARTSDNKENECNGGLLDATPLTIRKSNSLYHKTDERTILESVPDYKNKTKELRDESKSENVKIDPQFKKPSTSVSLQIGNSDIITVNKLHYMKLRKLGKGGSSVVYEVLDMQTKQTNAIKVVTLDDDETMRLSYKNEIKILQRLQHSNRVIKLFDNEESSSHLKLVMEAGNVDLSGILNEARQKNSKPIPSYTVKHYWREMLLAVQVIHKEGIIHSDLKPANFLSVNGMLKLIDFGIASSVQQDMTSVFKDSQSGTYNFMSPESLNDIHSGPIISSKGEDKAIIKINVKSDVWSLGCILYNLVYGKTPFQHLVNALHKLAAISNPRTKISFPSLTDKHLLDVLQSCLRFDPYTRPSIKELLCHPYLEESASVQEKPSPSLTKV